jgi:hypothetical protein
MVIGLQCPASHQQKNGTLETGERVTNPLVRCNINFWCSSPLMGEVRRGWHVGHHPPLAPPIEGGESIIYVTVQ